MKSKIDTVIMYMRAYEDGLVAPYIVKCDSPLPLKEGMLALADDCWNYFRQEHPQFNHNCSDPGSGKYCQHCGFRLGNDYDLTDFTDFMTDFIQMTYNDAPHEGAVVGNKGWVPFTWRFDVPADEWCSSVQNQSFYCIEQYAEQLLAVLVEHNYSGTFGLEDMNRARFLCAPHQGKAFNILEWVDAYFKSELPDNK